MRQYSFRRLVFLTWLALFLSAPVAEAHRGHPGPSRPPTAAEVTEEERRADAALLWAIRSEKATEREIEDYTDRLFERDGERVSEATRERLEAILEAALSVEKYRRSKVVWHQRGALLFEGAYYDTAISAFQRALSLDPGYFPSLLGGGNAYLAKGKVRRAARRFLRAVRVAPGEPLGWFHLTQALIRLRPPSSSPRSAARINARIKEKLTAFALLRSESLSPASLPRTLLEWKATHREALGEARRLTLKQFVDGIDALAPSIREALAAARKGGITFREAQRFEDLRGDYLSEVERRIRPRMGRYFAGLIYDPDRFRLIRSMKKFISRLPWHDDRERVRNIIRGARERGSGAIVITLEEHLGSGRPSRIYVLDQMFETPSIASEGDLISAFVNHERIHVSHIGEGIRLRSGRRIDLRNFTSYHEVDLKIPGRPPVRTVLVAPEVMAYAEELRQVISGKARVTPLYIRSAASNFRLFYGLLERIAASGVAPDNEFARELADEVKDVVEALRAGLPLLGKPKPSRGFRLGEQVYVATVRPATGSMGMGGGLRPTCSGRSPGISQRDCSGSVRPLPALLRAMKTFPGPFRGDPGDGCSRGQGGGIGKKKWSVIWRGVDSRNILEGEKA